MKFVLTSLILLCVTNVFSTCGPGSIIIYPVQSTLFENPTFLLESSGYSSNDRLENLFVVSFDIFLISNEDTVGFDVVEKLRVNNTITQVLIRPTRRLKVGSKYKFIYGDYFAKDTGLFQFVVQSGEDLSGPVLVDKLQLRRTIFNQFGCGNDEAYVFNNPAADSSGYLVKAVLKNLTNENVDSAYLMVTEESNRIILGHNMCSGHFYFESNCEYEVLFTFIDMYRNFGESVKYYFKFDLY